MEAAQDLTTANLSVHVATTTETAIDFEEDGGSERGFVVQMYDDGILRDAWFFFDRRRMPIPSDVVEAVLAAAVAHR
jgi:hypothetical protein